MNNCEDRPLTLADKLKEKRKQMDEAGTLRRRDSAVRPRHKFDETLRDKSLAQIILASRNGRPISRPGTSAVEEQTNNAKVISNSVDRLVIEEVDIEKEMSSLNIHENSPSKKVEEKTLPYVHTEIIPEENEIREETEENIRNKHEESHPQNNEVVKSSHLQESKKEKELQFQGNEIESKIEENKFVGQPHKEEIATNFNDQMLPPVMKNDSINYEKENKIPKHDNPTKPKITGQKLAPITKPKAKNNRSKNGRKTDSKLKAKNQLDRQAKQKINKDPSERLQNNKTKKELYLNEERERKNRLEKERVAKYKKNIGKIRAKEDRKGLPAIGHTNIRRKSLEISRSTKQANAKTGNKVKNVKPKNGKVTVKPRYLQK